MNRRKFILGSSCVGTASLSGCISANNDEPSNSTNSTNSEDSPSDENEEINSIEITDSVGVENDEESEFGRKAIALEIPTTALIEYEVSLDEQPGYEKTPIEVSLVDADNHFNSIQNEPFDTIEKGSRRPIEKTTEFSLEVPAGLYYLHFESHEPGTDAKFSLSFTSYYRINDVSCSDESPITIEHVSLVRTPEILDDESSILRSHIQYNGEQSDTYKMELTVMSPQTGGTLHMSETQLQNCKTNFIISEEEVNIDITTDEAILAEVVIQDEEEDTLYETTEEITDVHVGVVIDVS